MALALTTGQVNGLTLKKCGDLIDWVLPRPSEESTLSDRSKGLERVKEEIHALVVATTIGASLPVESLIEQRVFQPLRYQNSPDNRIAAELSTHSKRPHREYGQPHTVPDRCGYQGSGPGDHSDARPAIGCQRALRGLYTVS